MSKIVPRPNAWPVIGTLGALIASGGAEKLHNYVNNRHKELGPIYREKIGPTEGIFVSNPDYMRRVFATEGRYPQHVIPDAWKLYNKLYGQKRGLLFMDGEEWHKFRKILNGVILKPQTSRLTSALSSVAEDLARTWCETGQVHDLDHQLYKWSLKSIIAILAGDQSHRDDNLKQSIEELSRGVHNIFKESGKLSLMPVEIADKLNLPVWKRFVNAVHNSFETAQKLLQNLNAHENGLLKSLKSAGISESDLNRIVIDLILAAGDTTAYTTQWLFYLLATHKNVQEKIHQSLKKDQMENQLLKGALRETLRLYPVAPFVTRYLPETIKIDGYTLNKGELVIMSLYTSGRDGSSFPDPDQFQPERWLRTETGYQNVKNPHASLPFAMGARSCIGRKIAETQITLTAGTILKTMKLTCSNSDKVDIKLNLITVPSVPIQLNLQRRS